MRALVTGATDSSARHLLEHLRERGDEVFGVDRECDVTDEASVREVFETFRPDVDLSPRGAHARRRVVAARGRVHARERRGHAARPRRRARRRRRLDDDRRELLRGLRRREQEDLPLRETFRVAPANPYSSSKVEAETWRARCVDGARQRVIIARPFNHVGPGQSADVRRARAGDALARREGARRDRDSRGRPLDATGLQ